MRAHLWDVASQQRIQRFTGHGGVHAVAFSPDEAILTGGADGAVRVHLCTVCGPVDHLLEIARDRTTRALTPAERERFLHEPSR